MICSIVPILVINVSPNFVRQFILLGSTSGGNDKRCGAKDFPDIFVRISHSANLKFIITEYFNTGELL